MRVKRVILKNHSNIAIFGWQIIYFLITYIYFTLCNFLKPCNHTQCCSFTATTWPNQNTKFFVGNFKREILNYLKVSKFFIYIF